jgi:hypothetical protein
MSLRVTLSSVKVQPSPCVRCQEYPSVLTDRKNLRISFFRSSATRRLTRDFICRRPDTLAQESPLTIASSCCESPCFVKSCAPSNPEATPRCRAEVQTIHRDLDVDRPSRPIFFLKLGLNMLCRTLMLRVDVTLTIIPPSARSWPLQALFFIPDSRRCNFHFGPSGSRLPWCPRPEEKIVLNEIDRVLAGEPTHGVC